jgi:hypothetical protein
MESVDGTAISVTEMGREEEHRGIRWMILER